MPGGLAKRPITIAILSLCFYIIHIYDARSLLQSKATFFQEYSLPTITFFKIIILKKKSLEKYQDSLKKRMIKDINLKVELMTDERSLPASDVEKMQWQQLQEEPNWRWSPRFASLYLSAPLPTIVQLRPSLLLVEAIIRLPNLSCWLIVPSILSFAQPVKTKGTCVTLHVNLR